MKKHLAAAALLLALPASAADLPKVEAWRAAHEAQILGQLDDLVRFRSIAADPAGLAATAAHLQDLLKARGFDV